MSRYRDPQLQVGENYLYMSNLIPIIYNSQLHLYITKKQVFDRPNVFVDLKRLQLFLAVKGLNQTVNFFLRADIRL